ncbi:MAG: hypothetical protein ABIN91_14895 [Mucilaginibacter sp.]|uniref:hypothetical protein n=1 Tax=Mucilaginibacter sp. TaxID=1882438 RepID=UPI00326741E2
MKTELYTFIMEYWGGTYISQVEAADHKEAIKVWIVNLEISEIKGFSEADKAKAIDNDDFYDATLLKGLTNVWCIGFIASKGYALINFVKTK